MTLADVRDYIASLGIAEHVYMGKLPYHTAIGGPSLESYGTKYVTLLVHWNKSLRDTETAATALFETVRDTENAAINHETIKFIQPLYETQDVGTDDSGVCEMVIEMAVIYEKKGKGD